MATKTAPKSGAIEILHRRYYEGKPERLASLEEERLNAKIARKIYELRTASGLSQRQLAVLVGTTASVICRLEDADYEGHSLSVLQRIAAALKNKIQVQFIPLPAASNHHRVRKPHIRSRTVSRRSRARDPKKNSRAT